MWPCYSGHFTWGAAAASAPACILPACRNWGLSTPYTCPYTSTHRQQKCEAAAVAVPSNWSFMDPREPREGGGGGGSGEAEGGDGGGGGSKV